MMCCLRLRLGEEAGSEANKKENKGQVFHNQVFDVNGLFIIGKRIAVGAGLFNRVTKLSLCSSVQKLRKVYRWAGTSVSGFK
ncbi:MAG: hypothetical protein MUD08_17860, partial [Cytophagales bacterium]|nr:hypothetical protein [Cytophagales bacterium]